MSQQHAAMERLLLTAEEVADALHIGRARVFALIAAKEITSVKIGNLRRIPVEAVREYAARLVQLEREEELDQRIWALVRRRA
jgi:excisionase family DNA binding protein